MRIVETEQKPTYQKEDTMSKIILDLCGGTGSRSLPYKENGFDVWVITLPEYDVRTYKLPNSFRVV